MLNSVRVYGLSLSIVFFSFSIALSAPKWEKIHQEKGVTVYKRDSSLGDLPDFKATTTVDGSIFDVIAVIRDVDRREEWVFRCEDSKVVKRDTDFEVLLYHRTDSPWPTSDRDAAITTRLYEIKAGQEYLAHFKGVKNKLIPKRDDAVRLPIIEGYYRLKLINNHKTHVTYFVHLDPGGYIPRFLVRMTTHEFPTTTLIGLRRQVKNTIKSGIYKEFQQKWNPLLRPVGVAAPAVLPTPSSPFLKRLGL